MDNWFSKTYIVFVYRPPVHVMWPNNEVVEFQPQSVTTKNLDYVIIVTKLLLPPPLSAPLAVIIPSEGDYASFPQRHIGEQHYLININIFIWNCLGINLNVTPDINGSNNPLWHSY